MDKDEALKLALEALTNAIAVRNGEGGTKFVNPLEPNAITAIKAALAQPAQSVQGSSLQEQLDKANADQLKAYAEWHKAYAECHKTYAEVERLQQLIEEKNT